MNAYAARWCIWWQRVSHVLGNNSNGNCCSEVPFQLFFFFTIMLSVACLTDHFHHLSGLFWHWLSSVKWLCYSFLSLIICWHVAQQGSDQGIGLMTHEFVDLTRSCSNFMLQSLRQVVHCDSVTQQYKLIPATENFIPGKVSTGLALHLPCVADFSGLSLTTGSLKARKKDLVCVETVVKS